MRVGVEAEAAGDGGPHHAGQVDGAVPPHPQLPGPVVETQPRDGHQVQDAGEYALIYCPTVLLSLPVYLISGTHNSRAALKLTWCHCVTLRSGLRHYNY